MTDFLSRLIARSTGRAEVAHPVLAPLFATGPALVSEVDAQADSEGGGTAEPALLAPPAVGTRDSPEPPTLAQHAMEAASPLAAATAVPAASDVPRVLAARPRPAEDEAATEERRPGTVVESRPANRQTGSRRVRVSASPGRVDPRTPFGDGAEEPRSGAPARGPRVRLRPAEARREPRRVTDAVPMEASPAPIIRISIGRIDVRAVSPAAPRPVPPVARKDDRLALEDYLKPLGRRR